MSKMVTEVLSKTKGEDKINDILTGKGSFSQQGFGDLVSALANDTTFNIKTYGKDGQPNGEINISELIRADVKSTIAKAGYPQESEKKILDTAEICTKGLSKAIPHFVMGQVEQGKKFDLPTKPSVGGSIYLNAVKGKEKTTQVRDPKTQENLGSVKINTKDSVQIRAKSPVPASLQTKVRMDPAGNIINK